MVAFCSELIACVASTPWFRSKQVPLRQYLEQLAFHAPCMYSGALDAWTRHFERSSRLICHGCHQTLQIYRVLRHGCRLGTSRTLHCAEQLSITFSCSEFSGTLPVLVHCTEVVVFNLFCFGMVVLPSLSLCWPFVWASDEQHSCSDG